MMNSQDADLRDIFAALAMQGILANPNTLANAPYYIAREAYNIADAMLEVREEREDD